MKTKIFNLIVALICFNISSFAWTTQSDTTFFYVSKSHKLCAPDSAFFVIKKYKLNDKLWSKVEIEKNSLDTNYALRSLDSNFEKFEDTVTHFSNNDKKVDIYQHNKLQKVIFYSRLGKLEGYELLEPNGKGVKEQKGWDSLGNIIPNYIGQREARFNTEAFGHWTQYLIANLNSNVPFKNGAPDITYKVIVQFSIDKEGKVIDVKALNDPGYGTAEEAVRVVQNSPNWIPAIQNNKPVIYRQKQQVIFQVP